MIERSDDTRDQLAAQTVANYAAWSAVAGIIPLPIVDVAAVAALQLRMLKRLADIYGAHFTDDLGKSVLASLVGSILPTSVGSMAAGGVMSLLKSFPTVGSAVASLSLPALSAGSTYAVGKVFIQHFASDGTLLDFNPHDYREFMRSQQEKRATTVSPSPSPSPAAP